MMVAFVLGEVAAYQMGMTVWFIIAAALFLFHRKLCPMKHKAHSFSPAVIKTAEGRGDSDFQTDAERVWNWKDPMMCRVFLLFFCFLAGWGRMTVEMRPDALERMVTQKGGSAEVAVSGTLDSISEKNGWCTMILTGVEVEDESVRKVLISCKSDLLEMCEEKILPPCGSQIHLTGTAEFLEEARNPGQFSYRMYYRGLGIRNRVTADQIFISEGKSSPLRSQAECFRAYATAVFQEICVPEDAGIFQAILLGDKSGLSEELRERFQDNGIAHILAVSGLHVSLIGMSVYSALRFWGISYGWAGLVASALLTFYGFCHRIWSIGIPGGIYGRGVLSGGISGAELRSAECAVAVFDFTGVAVAVSALFGGIAAFLWRGCRDWAGDGGAAESGKKEKRAGRGETRERKKERI